MSQEKKPTNLSRSKYLEQRFSDAFDALIILILAGAFLLLKWDRNVFLWLGKLFSYIPLLKLIPQETYTVIPQILDAGLFGIVIFSIWDLIGCLGGAIGDVIKTSFAKKTERYWNLLFICVKFCIPVIFLRLAMNPNLFSVLWLRELGDYAHEIFFLDQWGAAFIDFVDSILLLLQAALQLALCFTGVFFLLAMTAVCFSSLRELIQNPKPRPPKAPKAPKQTKHMPKLGTSGLRKDVAQEADSRLAEFLSAQDPPEADDSCLRVQIPDPRELNRDRLYQWNDRDQIHLVLANYELTFLRQDDRAYLLGSEQLELLPNVPEVVWLEGRTKSQKLILTYIV